MVDEVERIKMDKLKRLMGKMQQNEGDVGMVMDVDERGFDEAVLKSSVPVVVDFWAEWCMPCGMLAPIFKELAKEYAGKLKFVKVNVDDNPVLAARYGVQGIPTLVIFRNGKEVERVVGAYPKAVLNEILDRVLG